MSVRRKTVLAATGAAMLTLGIAVPTMASAAHSSASAAPTAARSVSPPTAQPGWARMRAEHEQQLAEALAKELGMPTDKVAAALKKVQTQMEEQARAAYQKQLKEHLQQAVSAGKLTQEQADAILKAANSGVLRGGFDGGPHGPGQLGELRHPGMLGGPHPR